MIRLIKILILFLLLNSSQSNAHNECDTIKYKLSFPIQSITADIIRANRVFLYTDSNYIHMRISSGVVVVSRISLCNELGLCSSNYFHPSPGNEKVEIKKLSEIRFIIIEVWEDIIIYQFYETYIYEIKK